jgi:leukotriene-A4 hydrolase
MSAPPETDPHSHARPHEARVRHVTLDLVVDFETRTLSGSATLDLDLAPGATSVALDTRALAIGAVTDPAGAALAFAIGPEDPVLGACLTVALPPGLQQVVVHYATAPGAEALQWLDPEQTAGGEHPFLFTQGHAIQTRSWIPLQDSPGIRVTYAARVAAPTPLVAVMSAERETADDGTYRFRMNEPIPAYLIALAVGDLASRSLGPRTAVFAEPAMLERAAHELVEMEAMIEAAESMLGPYLWGRFDVLVMPPSFPYGGMENPRLVFASPSLIVGDRSLTTVIAHELAHAWAGNLVTNATWRDFWINEGTTVYLELRINEALWGADRAGFLMGSGFRDLADEIDRIGADSPDTRLAYDMTGRDPAEGVTAVPYLKGAAFFWTLERAVGRLRLDRWLRGWFERKAFRSVSTDQLLDDLREHLLEGDELARPPLDWARWVGEPGLPPGGAPPPSALLAEVEAAAARLLAGGAPADMEVAGWSPQAWRHFLGTVLRGGPNAATVAALDATFALSRSDNPEIAAPWLRLAVSVRDEAAIDRLDRFLTHQGRLKYLRPLYADLLASPWGTAIALRIFAKARPRHHALVQRALDRLFAAAATAGGAGAPG